MQFYKRFLSAFSCLLVLFGLFSFPVFADEVDTSDYKVNIYAYEPYLFNGFGQLDLDNGQSGTVQKTKTVTYKSVNQLAFRHQLSFVDKTSAPMFKAGKVYSFSANNLAYEFGYRLSNGSTLVSHVPDTVYSANLVYSDNSTEDVQAELEYIDRYDTYTVRVNDIKPKKDVVKLVITVGSTEKNPSVNPSDTFAYMTMGTVNQAGTTYNLGIDINVQSEEAGLLSGLLKWVKDIFDTVSYGFASIGTWFAELPGKIWSVFEEGIKGLFVPDDVYMSSYKDKWDQLLSSRLGAVYQVCAIVTDSWDSIMAADATNTINLPSTTIPLADSSFTFGGYDVQIVPAGFSVLVEALKLIIGITCTYLFVNGLLKRYDEVMGVEK